MTDYTQEMQQEPGQAPGFFMPEIQPKIPPVVAKLAKFIDADNVADLLDDVRLNSIGRRVVDDYEVDLASRRDWEGNYDRWLKMAQLAKEEKSWPWPNAANVKLPLIANAAMKFAARAYGEIIRDNKVVKVSITGQDKDDIKQSRANRVSEHMSYQLLEQETEWEGDTDKLLHMLAFIGHMFRKRYYSKTQNRMCSEILSPKDFVVNAKAKDLRSARRGSQLVTLHSNEVYERKSIGVFRDVDYSPENQQSEPEEEKYYEFIEQHRYLDLDGDGYEEPYIVIVERQSYKVAHISPRYDVESIQLAGDKLRHIEPIYYVTDYIFIPAFDGGYYGVGYGYLLDALNSTADSIFNQLLDSGTLANTQGGFLSREITMKGGVYGFQPGEWKKTNATSDQLSRGVMPMPTKEPSAVLFNLLGMIIEMSKDLSAVKDVLAGDSPAANVPATTVMALIEQGMKTYNAIYKRIYRGLKAEFKVQYRLNYMYLDDQEYYRVHDQDNVILKDDYKLDDCDVTPVADPAMSSEMQRLTKAQVLIGSLNLPGVNPKPIVRQFFEAVRAENIDEILPQEDGPNPHAIAAAKDLELREREVVVKEKDQALRERESEAKYQQMITGAIKNIADAEAAEAGTQISAYTKLLDSIHREAEASTDDNQSGLSGMGEQPGNEEVPQADGSGEMGAYSGPDITSQQPELGAVGAGTFGAQQPHQGN